MQNIILESVLQKWNIQFKTIIHIIEPLGVNYLGKCQSSYISHYAIIDTFAISVFHLSVFVAIYFLLVDSNQWAQYLHYKLEANDLKIWGKAMNTFDYNTKNFHYVHSYWWSCTKKNRHKVCLSLITCHNVVTIELERWQNNINMNFGIQPLIYNKCV